MGSGVQQKTGSQVFYDQEKGQYYTIENNNQNEYNNPIAQMFSNVLGAGRNRNYLGQSLNQSINPDRFTPNYIQPNYPNMGELFPALDIGLAQNINNSLLAPTDNTSSGASRFLAPSTSSKGK